jgi:hypothetical protein
VYVTIGIAGTATFPVSWSLYNPNGTQNCYASFTFKSPATTWVCRLYAAGTYQGRVGSANGAGYISTSIS